MNDRRKPDVARYWAGLAILERLGGDAPGLTNEEVRAILGARSVKGIGAALSGTRLSLGQEGVRLDEALVRRQVRGRSLWSAGPRIRQARHALEHARRMWTRRERGGRAPLDEAPPGHPGPVLVLRTLASRGAMYAIDSGIAGLDTLLDDEWFEAEADGPGSIGEIFIDRIEPGRDGRARPVPEGYGENGIWVRGRHDYANPRVAGTMGTGRHSTLLAWIGEARWFERRIALVDAVHQVQEVRAQGWLVHDEQRRRWHAVDGEARTAALAIGRWRTRHARHGNALVVVRAIRIAKRQPRPMPPGETLADGAVSRHRGRD